MPPVSRGAILADAELRPPPRRVPGRMQRALLLAALSLPVHLGLASGTVCHPARVPAATLLLPYFEVGLTDPNGLTTLFSINNAAAAAVLAHVSIWSDLSVPLLNFNVYLTGYDVQTINLRDVLVYGQLPQTAAAGEDPNDTISPKGPLSQDVDFPGCQGKLPPPPLPAAITSHLQLALTGKPSPILGGLCAGQNLVDNVARGYVTVDTVKDCTMGFPGDPGYFAANGAGDVTDQNVLWGVWTIVNAAQGFAQGAEMVAIEAEGTDAAVTAMPGHYTFYGRFDGWTAVDHREPLATTFAAQFAGGAVFSGTEFLVWRDPKVAQGPFLCPASPSAGSPPWYPMGQEGVVIFDEMEHAAVAASCPFAGRREPSATATPQQCPPEPLFAPFPAATQRVLINGAQFPVPFNFGWTLLDLNARSAASAGNNPAVDPLAQQAWVVFTQSANGHFAVALDAYRLDSACAANHTVPH